ncbi:hypothetical protein [Corynebacterium riegelii]
MQDLRGEINAVQTGIDNMIGYARAAALGTPPDPAAPNVAAELTTARLLNRGITWDMKTIATELNKYLGTPTAALFVEELVARGMADADTIDALIEKNAPAISEARTFHRYAQTAMANVFTRLMADIDELHDRGPLAPRAATPEGKHHTYRVDLADVFITGPANIANTGAYTYDLKKLETYRG